MTRIRLIVRIIDFKKAFSIDYIYIKKTKAKKTVKSNIITTSHFVKSNIIFIINLNAN